MTKHTLAPNWLLYQGKGVYIPATETAPELWVEDGLFCEVTPWIGEDRQ